MFKLEKDGTKTRVSSIKDLLPTDYVFIKGETKDWTQVCQLTKKFEKRISLSGNEFLFDGQRVKIPSLSPTPEDEWCWIETSKGYEQAKIVDENTVRTKFGKLVTVRVKDLVKFKPSSLLNIVEDLVYLEEPSTPLILHNIQERFNQDLIYTKVGNRVLISVNPFKQIEDTVDIGEYRENNPSIQNVPHTWTVAWNAYTSLIREGLDQSIIISGESGAGKTETCKQITSFIAEKASSNSDDVEQKVLDATPILEALGNARTHRNDNSSRFGKWMELHVSRSTFELQMARIVCYLLERSRVVGHAEGYNFHVLYMVAGNKALMERLHAVTTQPTVFKYLGNRPVAVQDDSLLELEEAMKRLNFVDQETFFNKLLGVLCLGNVNFELDETTDVITVANPDLLKFVSQDLLRMDYDTLTHLLLNRVITVREEVSIIPLTLKQCSESRDAFAKAVYQQLFDEALAHINSQVAPTQNNSNNPFKKFKMLGVLDIFGFEASAVNGFETLMINYCNEKLQQFYNQLTFKDEAVLYKSEKLGALVGEIKFIDNQACLDVLESRNLGLFQLISEQVKLPGGSEQNFLRQLEKRYPDSSLCRVKTSRIKTDRPLLRFEISHFAAVVEYDCQGWLKSNNDPLHCDELLKGGKNSLSICHQFKQDLASLIELLGMTEARFIKCLKSNDLKAGNKFDAVRMAEQLKCSGVLETVEIRKQGYPYRLTNQEFAYKFGFPVLGYKAVDGLVEGASFSKELVEALRQSYPQADLQDIKFGENRVFFRHSANQWLEALRDLVIETKAPKAQAYVRGHLVRLYCKRVKASEDALRAAMERFERVTLREALMHWYFVQANTTSPMRLILQPGNVREAKELLEKLDELYEIEVESQELLREGSDESLTALLKLMNRKDALTSNDVELTTSQIETFAHAYGLLTNYAQRVIDPLIEKALSCFIKEELEAVCVEASKLNYDCPQLQVIRSRHLNKDAMYYLGKQIELAVHQGRASLRIQKESEFHQLFMRQHGNEYAVEKFPFLRPDTSMSFNKKPLSHSLTDFPKLEKLGKLNTSAYQLNKEALRMNKLVMKFMGDRATGFTVLKSSSSNSVDDLMQMIEFKLPELKLELLLQLMRQIKLNPKESSKLKGIEFLGICLSVIEIEQGFLYYLKNWLMNSAELTQDVRARIDKGMRKVALEASKREMLKKTTKTTFETFSNHDVDTVEQSYSADELSQRRRQLQTSQLSRVFQYEQRAREFWSDESDLNVVKLVDIKQEENRKQFTEQPTKMPWKPSNAVNLSFAQKMIKTGELSNPELDFGWNESEVNENDKIEFNQVLQHAMTESQKFKTNHVKCKASHDIVSEQEGFLDCRAGERFYMVPGEVKEHKGVLYINCQKLKRSTEADGNKIRKLINQGFVAVSALEFAGGF